MTIARSNKVGIIMLNTHFPRLHSDIARTDSFDAECEVIKLEKNRVLNIVQGQIASEFIEEIADAAYKLQHNAASIVTISCGFLGLVQEQIQAQLEVPFIASSLSLTPFLRVLFGPTTGIGIMTFYSQTLNQQNFGGSWDQCIYIAGHCVPLTFILKSSDGLL